MTPTHVTCIQRGSAGPRLLESLKSPFEAGLYFIVSQRWCDHLQSYIKPEVEDELRPFLSLSLWVFLFYHLLHSEA